MARLQLCLFVLAATLWAYGRVRGNLWASAEGRGSGKDVGSCQTESMDLLSCMHENQVPEISLLPLLPWMSEGRLDFKELCSHSQHFEQILECTYKMHRCDQTVLNFLPSKENLVKYANKICQTSDIDPGCLTVTRDDQASVEECVSSSQGNTEFDYFEQESVGTSGVCAVVSLLHKCTLKLVRGCDETTASFYQSSKRLLMPAKCNFTVEEDNVEEE